MRIAGMVLCALLTFAQVVNGEDVTRESRALRPPTRIPLHGVLHTVTGEPRSGEVSLVLSIYADRDSAEALFAEEQTVVLREDGRYEIALGATSELGLPAELFGAHGARWVGIAEKGDLEQPRFMLVSVPYATKALDADAVGGRPVKDFVLAEELDEKVASVLAGGRAADAAQNEPVITQDAPPARGPRSFVLDLNPRSEADAAVAAAGRFTNEAVTGAMYGVHAHVHSTSAGTAESGPTGVFGEVAVTNPGSWSAGVRGINRGTGGQGIGVVGAHSGSGWGVYGTTPNGIAVYGASANGIGVFGNSGGTSAGVFAMNSGGAPAGTALQIQGGIKVSGTSPAAFVHTNTEGTWWTTIDHPLTNGNADAILLVTQRAYMGSFLGSPAPMCCRIQSFGVIYVPEVSRWLIVNHTTESIPAGAEFNILVIDQ